MVNAAQQSLNNRSNSRTSGHSALSNMSGGGGNNTSISGGQYAGSSLNLINTRLSEQQGVIAKYVEKEKRSLNKIKELKAENKKLM